MNSKPVRCVTCEALPAVTKLGECANCYQYRRRNGIQRPKHLCDRQFELNSNRRFGKPDRRIATDNHRCTICGRPGTTVSFRGTWRCDHHDDRESFLANRDPRNA